MLLTPTHRLYQTTESRNTCTGICLSCVVDFTELHIAVSTLACISGGTKSVILYRGEVSLDPSILNFHCLQLWVHVMGLFWHEAYILVGGGETDNKPISKEVNKIISSRNVMKKIRLGYMAACVSVCVCVWGCACSHTFIYFEFLVKVLLRKWYLKWALTKIVSHAKI